MGRVGRDQGRAIHDGTNFLEGIPVLTTRWAPPSPGPSARWEGSQALTVPRKTAEWEDTQSICFLVRGGSRGSEPGGKGPETSCRRSVWRKAGLPARYFSMCWAAVFAVRLLRAFSSQGRRGAPRPGCSAQIPQTCFYRPLGLLLHGAHFGKR